MNNLLVWWLCQDDMEVIGKEIPGDDVPEYIQSEYSGMYGRAGRGRIWVAPQFGEELEIPWNDTPMTKRLEKCGGIVIRQCDAPELADLPGVITDLNLHRVTGVLCEFEVVCDTPTSDQKPPVDDDFKVTCNIPAPHDFEADPRILKNSSFEGKFDWTEINAQRLAELNPQMSEKAIEALREYLKDIASEVKSKIKENPQTWWAPYHMFWGMNVRNFLRENGFSERDLGVQNLDDYYIALVEKAVE